MATEGRSGPVAGTKVPLVGRVNERDKIVRAIRQSIERSEPRLVTVTGTAGVGKTRLVTEALRDAHELWPSARHLRGACRSEHGLQPAIARILRTRFAIPESADSAAQFAELRARVSELFGERRVGEMVHFLGAAMGIELPSTALSEAFDEDPATRETIARAVLRKFIEVDAHRAPLVLVVEDLHLAGSDGARFLRALIESMGAAPVTLLVTAGPELNANDRAWATTLGERHERVDLGPLDDEEARVLARALLTQVRDDLGEVPVELIDAAVEMAGGLPMLLEQIARIYFDEEVVGFREDGSAWVDLDKLDELELPMSVEDAVRTRLAALSPHERELLEKGAVMGPVFWLGGLVVLGRAHTGAPTLWGGGEDLALQFRDLLAGLEAKDFVLRMPESSITGDEEYIFKHNLERETLRKLVAHDAAKEFHLLLAEWLEFRLTERTEEHLDLLAEHYEFGDRPLRAARCYLESADRARARFANTKAVEHYRKGLALLGDFDVRLRFDAELHLGDVLQRLGQVDAALEAFRAMQAIAYRLDLRSKGGAAHNRIGRAYREVGQLDAAMKHLGTGLALFESAKDARGIASSLDDIGKVHWLKGNYESALRFMRDALERREKLGDVRSIALSLHNIGSALQDSGQYREGLEALTRALELRRANEDLPGLVVTLNNLGTIHQDRGEIDSALTVWLEALNLAREVGDRRREALLLVNIGEAQYRLRKPAEAIRILREAERICDEAEDRLLLAEVWRGLGIAHVLTAETSVARSYLERSVALFEQVRSKVNAAIARRSLAECLSTSGRRTPDGATAEDMFRESLSVFESVHNEVEWARTARAFAAFLRDSIGASDEDRAEAARLVHTADAIRAKLNMSVAGVDPGPIFSAQHEVITAHSEPASQGSYDPVFDGGAPEGGGEVPVVKVSSNTSGSSAPTVTARSAIVDAEPFDASDFATTTDEHPVVDPNKGPRNKS
ncbi:MAG: tetratricopeptide repeat protein [Myxococcales bacterium]|nr:tetratricopeptide repeat protein [Myxococcales bacterium]